MTTTTNSFTSAGGAAYISNRMDWETPTDLFRSLDDEFRFTLNAASSETNHKCQKYYTLEDSAFDHEWGGETVFCNPPYGRGNRRLGPQKQQGSQPQEHHRRHADTRTHRHKMVP